MYDNIVVFGPTHSGKSTLMGYLKVYDWSKEKYKYEVEHIRRKIIEEGFHYKKDMVLAYFVDVGKDERRVYDAFEKSKGGSKRIHIAKTGLGMDLDYTFIDTPGSDVGWKHKNEGIFLGDIGIYIIEIRKLLELSRKVENSNSYNSMIHQLFPPVYLWKHYKRMKRLIVAISKVDMESYGQYAVNRAEDVLRSFDIFKGVPIVPISIDVANRVSYNVVHQINENMTWYKGATLLDEVKKMLDNERLEDKEEPLLFAHIETCFNKTKFNNYPAIRVKILNGTIHVNDNIYIAPIKEHNFTYFAYGKVLSLKHETKGIVKSLTKGEVGGIIFSKLCKGNEKIKLNTALLKRTSMVLGDITDCRYGNLLYFNVDKHKLTDSAISKFINFRVGSRIKLIWFGKIISMHFLNIIDNDLEYRLVLMNTTNNESSFILPLRNNGKFFYEEYVLQLDDFIFANAILSDLEIVSETTRKSVLYHIEGEMSNVEKNRLYKSNQEIEITYDSKTDSTTILWNNLVPSGLKVSMELMAKYLKNKNMENCKISILPNK